MNIRKWTGIVLAVMLLSTVFTAGAATFTPGDYEASAQGFGGTVSVKLTVDEEAITAIEITGEGETPALGGAAIEQMSAAYVGQADAEGVDGMTGATITSDAVKAAVSSALAQARGEAQEAAQIAFTPGTYEGTAAGYNGDVVLSVHLHGGRHRVDRGRLLCGDRACGRCCLRHSVPPDHRIHLHRCGQRLRRDVYQPRGL